MTVSQQSVSFSIASSKIIDILPEYGIGLGMIIGVPSRLTQRGENDSMLLGRIAIIRHYFERIQRHGDCRNTPSVISCSNDVTIGAA